MAAKKVLLIDESDLFRKFLVSKMEYFGLEVIEAKTGLDGSLKLRSEVPDLIVMDYILARKSAIEVLKEKIGNPNTAAIPVYIVANQLEKNVIVSLAQYKVVKVFQKPLRVDQLFENMSKLLGFDFTVDDTTSIIEANMNEGILFIEVAEGLNAEKIDLLRFKIIELLEIHKVRRPKALIMMAGIDLNIDDRLKLNQLLDAVMDGGGIAQKNIHILTKSSFVKDFLSSKDDLKGILCYDSLDSAMDHLVSMKGSEAGSHKDAVKEKLISDHSEAEGESVQMRFEGGQTNEEQPQPTMDSSDAIKKISGRVAVVDDDPVLRKMVEVALKKTSTVVVPFENGKLFIEALMKESFNLVFLDLMMPEMNGFQVLDFIRKHKVKSQIIVLSALSKKETVVQAVRYGIKSYMIKPVQGKALLVKTIESLGSNF
jgi:DNA-binding response OmpR family regulator